MEMVKRIQKNRDALLEQYHSNLEDVYNLQDTLIQDILPSVADELVLGPETLEWAKEWLSDTSSIFRISRRNKFTRSFSLEAIQKNLIWRLSNLWPVEPPPSISNFHCLPTDIRDPFGRPILALEVTPIDEAVESHKRSIIRAFETLRIHLRRLYDTSEDHQNPPLQYVVLLDLSQLSLQSVNIDLFTWTIREIVPRFPGLLAAVFVLNYSWTHSGLWTMFKRLLPESALSRIFFPSNEEVVDFFTVSALPQNFGGTLPPLAMLQDPLIPKSLAAPKVTQVAIPDVPSVIPSLPSPSFVTKSWLSATSVLNPFFGYPVSASSGRGPTSFRHGRRRKRDLVRTLTTLFWMRWNKHITLALSLSITIFLFRLAARKGKLNLP